MNENISFLAKLLALLNEFGAIAIELKPVIQNLIANIRAESGMTTREIVNETGVNADSLEADLLSDLEH